MKLFRGAVDTIKRVYRYEKTTGMDVGALQGVMLIFAVVLFLIDIENFRLGKYVIGIVTLVVGIVSVTAVFVIRRFQKVVLVCRIAVFLFLLLAAAILYAGANDGFPCCGICCCLLSLWFRLECRLGHRCASDSACGSWRFSGRRLRIY